eukprot:SAG22_NODE_2658_length_2330_cov_2.505155_1_plen_87_part_10
MLTYRVCDFVLHCNCSAGRAAVGRFNRVDGVIGSVPTVPLHSSRLLGGGGGGGHPPCVRNPEQFFFGGGLVGNLAWFLSLGVGGDGW